jgi:anti-sigma factor RsiW
MCKFSTKLIAWLDRELEPEQMAELEQHLPNCDECRINIAKYERASQIFDDYCHAVMTAAQDQGQRRWLPILSAAAAILFLVATAAVVLRIRVQPLSPSPTAVVQRAQPPLVSEPATPPADAVRPRRVRPKPIRIQAGNALPLLPEPAVEVAIPADSMYPPGAVPEGVNFIADVNFAPDGSARQMRLRPRLTAIERSAPQP